MDPTQRSTSEELLEAEIRRGAHDPRFHCRGYLRELRSKDPAAFQRAFAYYGEKVIASVASKETGPLAAWRAYGLYLAEQFGAGDAVAIDPAGKAEKYSAPGNDADLVLYVAKDWSRAFLAFQPADPTPEQSATRAWLVDNARALK